MNHAFMKDFTLPSGVTLKNRIMMAPMTTNSGFENGMVSGDELAYYKKRSAGTGAVITACAYISYEGKAFPGGIGADTDELIPSLRKLAQTIQGEGAKAILQIFHGGRMVSPKTIGGHPSVSASAVAPLRPGATVPKELTNEEIEKLVEDFGEATRRAIEAGFDGVELHGANTYLIQQFFSPHSNRRTDKWGGTLEKRMAFPLAVIESSKKAVEKHAQRPFILGYRLSPEETEEPGIRLTDTLSFVERLMTENLDYLHISLGNRLQSSLVNKQDTEPVLTKIKKLVGNRVPIVGVGSIHTPEEANELAEAVELVAIGRELVMEPEWVDKVSSGHADTIRTTVSPASQEELVIPDPLWDKVLHVKGWFPVEE